MLSAIEYDFSWTKLYGIYVLENLKTGTCYVGMTGKGFEHRFCQHIHLLRGNRHYNKRLQRAFNRDNIQSFRFIVLEICNNTDDLESVEQRWIDAYSSAGIDLYNVCTKGKYALGVKRSQETKDKLSQNKKKFYADNEQAREELRERSRKMLSNSEHLLKFRKACLDAMCKTYKGLVSPTGVIYKDITNLKKFCREHSLNDGAIYQLAKGKVCSYKGWTLYKDIEECQ